MVRDEAWFCIALAPGSGGMTGAWLNGLADGGLIAALEARTRSALARGALSPIRTEQVEIEDGGVRFLLIA